MVKIDKIEKVKSTSDSHLLKSKLKSTEEESEFAENIIHTPHKSLIVITKI